MIPFKDLPIEIQQRMLDEQVRQGYPRNASMFEEGVTGGFAWSKSVDGCAFWKKILLDGNLAVFYEKYPKRPLLKVIPLHIKILDSKGLLEVIAETLLTKWHDEGRPAKVEIDWFEHGGFYWSANAEMEAYYVVNQYDYDITPESYCRGISVEIGAIECTDEAGTLCL